MLKRNTISNYLGTGWAALMALAFIPFYIKYMGIEAYGLVGIFAMIQSWAAIIDVGMTPTLNREMARIAAGAHSATSIRDLLRSIEYIAWGLGGAIASAIFFNSNWLASSWIGASSLPIAEVTTAFYLMGMVTSLRFVESIYRGSVLGLQRQVEYNILYATLATIRGVGAIGILALISPTITAFFFWQGAMSIVSVISLAILTYSSLPSAPCGGRFSLNSLRSVASFAGGMLGISLVTSLLTQADKLMLSKFLTLSEYGVYTLAAVVAGTLLTLTAPITQALFPRLSQSQAADKQSDIAADFHLGAQLVSVIVGSAAILFVVFPSTLLTAWTGDAKLAANASTLLQLLAIGNLLNAFMWVPYQTQLAHGWTSLTFRLNACAAVVFLPALLYLTPIFGAKAAASLWIALNSFYVLFGANLMFRRILSSERLAWYRDDLLVPLLCTLACVYAIKLLSPTMEQPVSFHAMLVFVAAAICAPLAASMAAGSVRARLFLAVVEVWKRGRKGA